MANVHFKKTSNFFLFLTILFSGCLESPERNQKQNISNAVSFFEDKTGELDFQKIMNLDSSLWHKNKNTALRFGFSQSVYWLKIDVHNFREFMELKNIYLVFKWKSLDSVKVFYLNREGSPITQIAGDEFPKSRWTLPETHFPTFVITPEDNPGNIYYVRLFSTSNKHFPVFLESESAWLNELKYEITTILVLSTITVIVVLFALFMYIMSRETNYLIYTAYILCTGLAFDIGYGNAFELFWPNATWWQNRSPIAFTGAQILCSLLFVSRLLDFERLLPKVNMACKILAVICAITLPLSLMNIPMVLFSVFYSMVYFFSIPVFWGIGIFLSSKSRPHIRIFIVGWGIYFIFGFIHILYLRNALPFSNFAVYGVMLLFPIDIFFFFMSVWEKQASAHRDQLKLIEEKMKEIDGKSRNTGKSRYQKSSLSEINMGQVLSRLDILMNQEKIFLIEDLRLADLAKAMRLNRTQLSELLNSRFNMNFRNFINAYRIEEAKKQLAENPDTTILHIAFATGFGSKAVFTSEFKRITGLTASEYRENPDRASKKGLELSFQSTMDKKYDINAGER